MENQPTNDIAVIPHMRHLKDRSDLAQLFNAAQANLVVLLNPETETTEQVLQVCGRSAGESEMKLLAKGFKKHEIRKFGKSLRRKPGLQLYVTRFIGEAANDAMRKLGVEPCVYCHRCGSSWRKEELLCDEYGHYCPKCPDHRAEYASLSDGLRRIP